MDDLLFWDLSDIGVPISATMHTETGVASRPAAKAHARTCVRHRTKQRCVRKHREAISQAMYILVLLTATKTPDSDCRVRGSVEFMKRSENRPQGPRPATK